MPTIEKQNGVSRKFGAFSFLFFSLALLVFLSTAVLVNSRPQWRVIKNTGSEKAVLAAQIEPIEQPGLFDFLSGPKKSASPTNFLLLGVAGPGNDAPDLTDTIIVAQIEPAKKRIYLFSLPRDLLVEIPGSEIQGKLNSLHALGKNNKDHEFDLIRQKTQEISGLVIGHVVLVDLAMVKNLVDTLGGVNVMVKKDIFDPNYPGPNYSYQTFAIKAGWRYLDGETALKYIRSRHSTQGDFDRIERQQQVLQALKQKVLQLNFWDLPTFLELFGTVASQVKTDLDLWQMKNFWEEIKDIPAQDTIKTDIENETLITTGQMTLGNETASVVIPRAGVENYEEIQNYIRDILQK